MSDYNNPNELIKAIKDSMKHGYIKEEVENYALYCWSVKTEADRSGKLKNPWFGYKTISELSHAFRKVKGEGLVFDGNHITWISTGVSYDYVAYKNKMLLAYPDTKIDVALVYRGDEFAFKKADGQVRYNHTLANPFGQVDGDIIGAYCVIINERGEFLTTMSNDEIDKHRRVAKTDFIWKQWFKEMALKTVIRKAVKFHFDDVFEGIEEMDNENYELPSEEKSDIDVHAKEIRDALKDYKGDDKEVIREMALEKYKSGELDRAITDNILGKLK